MAEEPEGLRQLRVTFGSRVERLHKLCGLNAPLPIICSEVLLVFKGAMALWPEEMGRTLTEWLCGTARGEVAICDRCLSYTPHEVHVCAACLRASDMEEPTH